MKKNLILLFIFTLSTLFTQAQDTLYIYKSGMVVTKRAIAQIDSISFTAPIPAATNTFQDLDGNIYHEVTIGNQIWMLENLKTTKYRNGESIPNITNNATWAALTTGAWCDYDNNPANGVIFGHLYNWFVVNDSRNIAPTGWHVPSDEEFTILLNYLIENGYNYDKSLTGNEVAKSVASTMYWNSSTGLDTPGRNSTANNTSGFNALPGGLRNDTNGEFISINDGSLFWTSTNYTLNSARYWGLFNMFRYFERYTTLKNDGFSIRCIKSDLPVVSTDIVSLITSNSANSGGNITSDGNDPIIERGVCWNLTGNPTINDGKTTEGGGKGTFNSSVNGLTPGTTYYLRAYATNSVGTVYGDVVTFKTWAVKPTLTSIQATEITSTTALSGGNISNDGGATISARGVCWSTTQNPTISNSKTADGAGPGVFVSSIEGLTPGTKYYLRAYATNEIETAYGEEISFTTVDKPTLTTSIATSITTTTAITGGTSLSDNGAAITEKGVCWGLTENLSIETNAKTTEGAGNNNFVSTLTGLSPNTTYFVRAYATNSEGTSYGNNQTFTTLIAVP